MNSRIGVSLFLVASVAGMKVASADICRVATDGLTASNGSSWGLATTLQSALANAGGKACDEIWVKRGVYRPHEGAVDDAARQISFAIVRPLKLYGGFVGSETLLSQRTQATVAANPTILSGDIDGNDIDSDTNQVDETTADIQGSNSFHVVVIGGSTTSEGNGAYTGSNTVLDGLIVTAGDATSDPSLAGGGLFCNGRGTAKQCSPTLGNVAFRGNRAGYGGALYALGFQGHSSPTLLGAVFGGNHATFDGGAIFNEGNSGVSSPTLTDVLLHDNSAGDAPGGRGGAMLNNGYNAGTSSPSLRRVTFTGNSATSSGGGMFNNADIGTSSPNLTDVTFHANTAERGGALYNNSNLGQAGTQMYRATLSSNVATAKGGGMYFRYTEKNSFPALIDLTFAANHAADGGAIYIHTDNAQGNAHMILRNVTFNGNGADQQGGALYSECNLLPAFLCAFTGIVLENAILLDDVAPMGPEVFMTNSQTNVSLNNSIVYNSGSGSGACPTLFCTNMTYADPKLGPLADNGGHTLTMLPGPGSAVIDAGDNAICPYYDQRGVLRPQGMQCDIGAVEISVSIFIDDFEETCFEISC